MADQSQLFDSRPASPGKILRELMGERGWTQDDLATITGRTRQTIAGVLRGGRISLEMAIALAAAFGNKPEDWLKWDHIYRLSQTERETNEVSKMAELYTLAPIREMQRRGWIKPVPSPAELEKELERFFGQNNLAGDLTFPVAPRRMIPASLNPAEKAWLFRARQLSKTLTVAQFSSRRLDAAEKELRQLAAYPKQARHLPRVLTDYGIRFVIVEPLPGVKIDGATFWLDSSQPVIAMSLRHDRIDGFWFTLMHEFAHVRHGDASVDTDLVDDSAGVVLLSLVMNEAERKANEHAASALIPNDEMESFIRRVGPYYARERVIQFAHKVKVHPGIIVGQLQRRDELGYSALREWLVKIRNVVISTALTDGWGQNVSPAIL